LGDRASSPLADPLANLLTSGTKADLLVLFHRNPGLIDTVDGIARRMGTKGKAIEQEIAELMAASILEKRKVGVAEVFYLNREKDEETQHEIARYINNIGKGSP
jgi:hypothetical protein